MADQDLSSTHSANVWKTEEQNLQRNQADFYLLYYDI